MQVHSKEITMAKIALKDGGKFVRADKTCYGYLWRVSNGNKWTHRYISKEAAAAAWNA